MELIVKTPTFPEIIEFNFSELKEEITKKASDYMNLVYSEDQIQDAKKDVATLRKFTKALSDERIKVKKECLKPYEDFETKIKELDGIVNMAIQNIDGQVKGFEEQKKAEKKQAILNYWNENAWKDGKCPIEIGLPDIFDEKLLNASVSMKTVCAEIDARLEQIAKDLETLSNLPEFSFEAIEEYKQSLDINKAIVEGQRLSQIQKRKVEAQQQMDEALKKIGEAAKTAVDGVVTAIESIKTDSTIKSWVSFKAHLSVDDAIALNNFFNSRNIEFEAI